MTKYSNQFKLSAIKTFLKRGRGFRHVADQFQIDPTLLRRWVMAYQLHGNASLNRSKQHHSPEFKLSVLHRMWREQLSQRATAALFNLGNSSQVGRWQQQYYSGDLAALSSAKKRSRTTMPKPPAKTDESLPRRDEDLSHAELLVKLRKLKLENAWLKKLEELDEEKMRQKKAERKKPG
jgi:transposase